MTKYHVLFTTGWFPTLEELNVLMRDYTEATSVDGVTGNLKTAEGTERDAIRDEILSVYKTSATRRLQARSFDVLAASDPLRGCALERT